MKKITFEPGARVRFSERMMTDLLKQKRDDHGAKLWLLRLSEVGMEAQNTPRAGRLNVRFRVHEFDPWSYRTYSTRDLVQI